MGSTFPKSKRPLKSVANVFEDHVNPGMYDTIVSEFMMHTESLKRTHMMKSATSMLSKRLL